MPHKKLHSVLWIILVSVAMSCSRIDYVPMQNPRLSFNDSIQFKESTYDDSHWTLFFPSDTVASYWFRTEIQFQKKPDTYRPYALEILGLSSYEVFFDGTLIGKNGKVGTNKQEEVPGKLITRFLIPDSLLQQRSHIIALKSSNFYKKKEGYIGYKITVKDFQKSIEYPFKTSVFIYAFAGVFLIVSLYYLFIFFQSAKEIVFVLFSVICLLFALLLVSEHLEGLTSITYDIHILKYSFIKWISALLSVVFPLFFGLYFKAIGKKALVSISIILSTVVMIIYIGDTASMTRTLSFIMWVEATGITTYAFFKKKHGSQFILIALLLSLIISLLTAYDISLFIGFGIVTVGMLYLLSLKMKQDKQAYESSLLFSARLETELLKRQIQPHFLMNTLTTLVEWIENSPKKGVNMIYSLSEEFRLLFDMVNKKQISIDQEIALCKKHLEVMSFRMQVDYIWKDEGIDREEMIPPAIIHTALENSITHLKPLKSGSISFNLTYTKTQAYKEYALRSEGIVIETEVSGQEGTGMKYIKARLKESYNQNWTLTSRSVENGWLLQVRILN